MITVSIKLINMNRLEIYKEIYQKEIERRGELNNDVSIPIGIISILATGYFFYISNFDFKLYDNLLLHKLNTLFFVILLTIGVIILLKSIYFLLKSYTLFRKKNIYYYLASPNEIEKYYCDYEKYFIDTGSLSDEAKLKANDELEKYFILAYNRTSMNNTSINDERATYLHNSKRYIVYSLIILLIAFLPYMINNFTKDDKINKIEVQKEIKIVSDSLIMKN